MRGGIPYISNRYGRANNKYMKNYDKNEPSKYIMYLDANNLYGYAMSQHFPTSGLKWLREKEIEKTDLGKYTEDSKFSKLIPQKLFNSHNGHTLAAKIFNKTEIQFKHHTGQ